MFFAPFEINIDSHNSQPQFIKDIWPYLIINKMKNPLQS